MSTLFFGVVISIYKNPLCRRPLFLFARGGPVRTGVEVWFTRGGHSASVKIEYLQRSCSPVSAALFARGGPVRTGVTVWFTRGGHSASVKIWFINQQQHVVRYLGNSPGVSVHTGRQNLVFTLGWRVRTSRRRAIGWGFVSTSMRDDIVLERFGWQKGFGNHIFR